MKINRSISYSLDLTEQEIKNLKDFVEVAKLTKYLPDHVSQFAIKLHSLLNVELEEKEILLDQQFKIRVPDFSFEQHYAKLPMIYNEEEELYTSESRLFVEDKIEGE